MSQLLDADPAMNRILVADVDAIPTDALYSWMQSLDGSSSSDMFASFCHFEWLDINQPSIPNNKQNNAARLA